MQNAGVLVSGISIYGLIIDSKKEKGNPGRYRSDYGSRQHIDRGMHPGKHAKKRNSSGGEKQGDRAKRIESEKEDCDEKSRIGMATGKGRASAAVKSIRVSRLGARQIQNASQERDKEKGNRGKKGDLRGIEQIIPCFYDEKSQKREPDRSGQKDAD